MMKTYRLVLCLAFLQSFTALAAPNSTDPLAAGFQSPPPSARPHTWWHWMNGNVTKEGITADLESMQRVGIGGAQIFNASEGIPPGPVKFNSPEWHEMFSFAVKEADRLGLELCIHNCAGWSSSGGPWNSTEQSMQHVVMTETKVPGDQKFSGTLPQPKTEWNVYHDIAVLAFRAPSEGASMKSAAPKITASIPAIHGDALLDNNAATFVSLPTNNLPQFVQLEFSKPFRSRDAVLTLGQGAGEVKGVIQVSEDGKTFRDVREFTTPGRPTRPLTFAFGSQPVLGKFYRIKFIAIGSRTRSLEIAGVDFSPRLRIENVDAKDGDSGAFVASSDGETSAPEDLLVKHDNVLDLTSQMDASGRLNWDAPAGDWIVLRVGRTPTGRNNHPAPDEGTGPECDKFSAAALDAHWAGFVQKCIDDAGPLAGKGKTFNNVLIDSYEVGGQNWSENFRAEFKERRGYDPLKFLPAFTGRVVDSPEISERFLFDVRRTISDLFADNYYGHFTELCDAHNMTASIEPYTGPYESMQQGAAAEIPMGEFWVDRNNINSSVKLASSVGHIYGRPIIGAESFTAAPGAHGRWQDDPYAIKALGDQVFCFGINRYIFHRFAMQPWTNRWPGMTMGQWGTHFDRTSTWWEQGRAWLQYVARCQFLLQRGRFVADAAYFCGENSPAEMRAGDPPLPAGYDFDSIGADALKDATVDNHQLVLKSGMRYRVLVLPPSDRNISPPLLKKIRAFVADGITLVGPPPEHAPGLQNYPNCDNEVKAIAAEIWGRCDGKKIVQNRLGKGRVYWGATMETVLAALNAKPDFEFTASNKPKLSYIHRTDGDAEIYFVSNQRDQFDSADCTFRVAGKLPELWHADTGVMEPAPVWREERGRTIVRLEFDPSGSVFVVFRQAASGDHAVAVTKNVSVKENSRPPKLVIRRAVYGEVARKPQSVDVTDKVKLLLASGKKEILANNELAGSDPALETAKQLRVDYSVAGRKHTETVDENQTLELPASARVTKALYGSLPVEAGASKQIDLTAKLSGLVESGALSVQIDNGLAGSDPSYGKPKECRVDYTLDGVSQSVTVAENNTLVIGKPVTSGQPPPLELRVGDNGKMFAVSTTPGEVKLTLASGKKMHAEIRAVPSPVEISGAWDLSFPPNWGAPEHATFDKLISWTDSPDSGVKYFSGTATYTKEIDVAAADLAAGKSLWLDLGRVKNLAEVFVNGKPLGILWKPPFRVNLAGAAQPGKNKLEIKITNLWPNRLIGDEQLPDDREWNGKRLREWPQWVLDGKPSPTGRYTFTTWHHWTKDDALLESGLLGPVQLIRGVETPLTN
jgi:(4-O-methyl)-D-glucuronate---lignin esterase